MQRPLESCSFYQISNDAQSRRDGKALQRTGSCLVICSYVFISTKQTPSSSHSVCYFSLH